MTTSSDSATTQASTTTGITRRTTIRAAAWSLPVLAAATAVPFAAASASLATLTPLAGTTIEADGKQGTASGSFTTSGLRVSNVSGEWSTGTLTTAYRLQGPWSTASITKLDGSAFVHGETIVHGGTTWTVTLVDADDNGAWEVHFTGLAVTVSADTVIEMPPAKYSGTFTPGVPSTRNPVLAGVSVAADEINGGAGVAASATYPA